MNLKGKLPESWACVDCGVNTAPRLLNREQMEQDFAVVRIKQSDGQIVDELSEVYTVRSKIWKAANIEPMGGCLCIGCLERRLGRTLTAKDFMPNHPFNTMPGTERLLARRAWRPYAQP
jgi:hypothetical protein